MSDRRMELEDEDEVVDIETSEDELSSTDQTEETRQPKSKTKPKVNLDDYEEFRKFKSESQRRQSQVERAAQEASNRAATLEQEMHRIRMSGMDETEQMKYENQLLKNQLNEVQQQRDLDSFAMLRQRDIEEMAAETGMPFDELAEASVGLNNHQTWKIARKWERENGDADRLPAGRNGRGERTPDDRVDLGAGSKPLSSKQKFQKSYDTAKGRYNLDEMWKIEEEAAKAGVTITT